MSGSISPTNAKAKNRQLIINGIVEYVSSLPHNNKVETKAELEGLLIDLMSGPVAKDARIGIPTEGQMATLVDVLNDYIVVGTVYNEKQIAAIIPAIVTDLEQKGLTFPEAKSPRPSSR